MKVTQIKSFIFLPNKIDIISQWEWKWRWKWLKFHISAFYVFFNSFVVGSMMFKRATSNSADFG